MPKTINKRRVKDNRGVQGHNDKRSRPRSKTLKRRVHPRASTGTKSNDSIYTIKFKDKTYCEAQLEELITEFGEENLGQIVQDLYEDNIDYLEGLEVKSSSLTDILHAIVCKLYNCLDNEMTTLDLMFTTNGSKHRRYMILMKVRDYPVEIRSVPLSIMVEDTCGDDEFYKCLVAAVRFLPVYPDGDYFYDVDGLTQEYWELDQMEVNRAGAEEDKKRILELIAHMRFGPRAKFMRDIEKQPGCTEETFRRHIKALVPKSDKQERLKGFLEETVEFLKLKFNWDCVISHENEWDGCIHVAEFCNFCWTDNPSDILYNNSLEYESENTGISELFGAEFRTQETRFAEIDKRYYKFLELMRDYDTRRRNDGGVPA